MSNIDTKDANRSILETLQSQELRIRKALAADADDLKFLLSEWQEKDSAAERNLRDVEWNQYSNLQNELSEIADAKQRLENNTYGLCENCGTKISAKRLKILPTARMCLVCQEKIEV